jgi:predicted Zn finger-like uncharacterized protein
MSLLTQCPACTTLFRVVQDQLRVSQGWVRCGQCSEVFQGNLYLQHAGDSGTTGSGATGSGAGMLVPPLATSSAASLPDPELRPADEAFARELNINLAPFPQAEGKAQAEAGFGDAPAANAPATDEVVSNAVATGAGEASTLANADQAALSADPHGLAQVTPGAPDGAAAPKAGEADAPSMPDAGALPADARALAAGDGVGQPMATDIGFLQAALPRPRSHWALRLLLGTGVLALMLALVWQFAVHERNRLAAMQPVLQPALEQMCALSACELAALQQIESLSIETSAFNAVKPGYYRLSVTVRNAAALALAMPSIELVLHDNQDEVLLRRVLSPLEFGVSAVQIGPSSESSGTVMVALGAAALGQSKRVAGYRLTAFYP